MTVEFSITLLHKPIAWTQLKRSMADKLSGCYVGMGAVKTENSIRKSVRRTSSTTLALAKPVANISDVYDLGEQIGTGAFGTVRLARHKPTGSAQALKKLRRSKVSRQELQTQTAIMASMDHPHVIKLMGVVQDVGGDVFVAMELASGGTCSTTSARRAASPRTMQRSLCGRCCPRCPTCTAALSHTAISSRRTSSSQGAQRGGRHAPPKGSRKGAWGVARREVAVDGL